MPKPVIKTTTATPRKTDRHDPSTVQLNTRVPRELLDAFYGACTLHDLVPSEALRSILSAFVEGAKASEARHD